MISLSLSLTIIISMISFYQLAISILLFVRSSYRSNICCLFLSPPRFFVFHYLSLSLSHHQKFLSYQFMILSFLHYSSFSSFSYDTHAKNTYLAYSLFLYSQLFTLLSPQSTPESLSLSLPNHPFGLSLAFLIL